MQFLVSILTIVMSGVAATAVTYLLNSRKEQVFFMRKKAEDLYLAAEGFDKNLSIHFLRALPLLNDKIDYNTYHDLIISSDNKDGGEKHETVLMLVQIYFPETEPEFNAWMAAKEKLNRILTTHKRAYEAGDRDLSRFIHPYKEAFDEFVSTSNTFKNAVVRSARRLTDPEALWPSNLTLEHWRAKVRSRLRSGSGLDSK